MTLELKPTLGDDLSDVIKKAIDLAERLDVSIEFVFNGTRLIVTKRSSLEKVLEIYYLK